MTSIRYRRLAFALIGVNASLLGLRYYNKGSVSGLSGNETSWAGRNGNWASRRTEEEEALQAQRSELLRRFRDPRLSKPKTTPVDLLIPDYDAHDGSPARDPGYTIAKSPGKGMGLFATRFIPANAKILDEKPVLTLPAGSQVGTNQMLQSSDLHGFVAQVFDLSPALREAVMKLQGERVALWRPQMEHYRELLRREEFPVAGDDEGTADSRSSMTVDHRHRRRCRRLLSLEERSQLEHVLRVFYTNAAALVGSLRLPSLAPTQEAHNDNDDNKSAAATKMTHVGDGLFLTFSRINHSCEANAVWDTCRRPGVMSIRAARDIRPGEEITISYFWETAEAVEKRRERTKGWGFVCQCLKCGPIGLSEIPSS